MMSDSVTKLKLDVPSYKLKDVMACIRCRVVEINVSKKRYRLGDSTEVTLDFEPAAHSISDYDGIKTVGNREEAMVPFFNQMTFHDKIKDLEGFTLSTVVRAAGQSEVSLMYFTRMLDDGSKKPESDSSLMTLEEQQRLVEVAKAYCRAPSTNDVSQRTALFSFIHRFVDKRLKNQAESPADGSTD